MNLMIITNISGKIEKHRKLSIRILCLHIELIPSACHPTGKVKKIKLMLLYPRVDIIKHIRDLTLQLHKTTSKKEKHLCHLLLGNGGRIPNPWVKIPSQYSDFSKV